jgi:hypothetical protein
MDVGITNDYDDENKVILISLSLALLCCVPER